MNFTKGSVVYTPSELAVEKHVTLDVNSYFKENKDNPAIQGLEMQRFELFFVSDTSISYII